MQSFFLGRVGYNKAKASLDEEPLQWTEVIRAKKE